MEESEEDNFSFYSGPAVTEEQKQAVRYHKLREFAEWCKRQSCCQICDCISCAAVIVLREIEESYGP